MDRLLERSLGLCQDWRIPLLLSRQAAALGLAYALDGHVAAGLALVEQGVEQAVAMDRPKALGLGRVPIFPVKLPAEQGVKWPSVSTSSTAPLCSKTATGVWPLHWRDTKRDWALSSED